MCSSVNQVKVEGSTLLVEQKCNGYGGITTMNDDVRRRPNTHSAARDQAEGNTQHAKGRIKEGWGALTGDERLQAEGQRDQVAGVTRVKKGRFKDRVKAWIDRI